jgi:GMP synthase-like glutamine amidotransferase
MLRVLYLNAIVGKRFGEILKEGTLQGLQGSRAARERGLEFVSYDMFYGARERPRFMGRFAREMSADAVILSGSDKNTTDREDPWVQEYLKGLRDLLEVPEVEDDWTGPNFPVLGICFGHQALACALGGDTSRFPNRVDKVGIRALPEAVRHPVFKDLLPNGVGSDLDVLVYHADHVVRLPGGFRPLFSSDYCTYQGMAHAQWPIVSLQSHPEMTSKLLDIPEEREIWKIHDRAVLDAQHGPVILASFLDWVARLR